MLGEERKSGSFEARSGSGGGVGMGAEDQLEQTAYQDTVGLIASARRSNWGRLSHTIFCGQCVGLQTLVQVED